MSMLKFKCVGFCTDLAGAGGVKENVGCLGLDRSGVYTLCNAAFVIRGHTTAVDCTDFEVWGGSKALLGYMSPAACEEPSGGV